MDMIIAENADGVQCSAESKLKTKKKNTYEKEETGMASMQCSHSIKYE